MKACMFDYLFIENLEEQLEKELIEPVRDEGYHLEHRSILDFSSSHENYNTIILHFRGISPADIELIQNLKKPILILSGTDVKLKLFKNYIGPTQNVEYDYNMNPGRIISFLENASKRRET